jgi:hypothetical protein
LHILYLTLSRFALGLQSRDELGVKLCQSEVDDYAFFCIGVIQKVAWLDVSVIYSQLLEIPKPGEQFKDVVLCIFDGECIEKDLNKACLTIKGLKWKYSSTMWVISWWTKRLTNLGRFALPLTSSRKAISA